MARGFTFYAATTCSNSACRFDVVAIVWADDRRPPRIEHIRGALRGRRSRTMDFVEGQMEAQLVTAFPIENRGNLAPEDFARIAGTVASQSSIKHAIDWMARPDPAAFCPPGW